MQKMQQLLSPQSMPEIHPAILSAIFPLFPIIALNDR